jgi:hypothetical protein
MQAVSFLPIGWRIFCLKKSAKVLSAEAACNPRPFGGHQTTLQTQNVLSPHFFETGLAGKMAVCSYTTRLYIYRRSRKVGGIFV